jgi:hypothetical protein
MSKQNSIEWYFEQRNMLENDIRSSLFGLGAYFKRKSEIEEQAKAMHKKEIEQTHFDAQCVYAKSGTTKDSLIESSKNYYNQKFGGSNE